VARGGQLMWPRLVESVSLHAHVAPHQSLPANTRYVGKASCLAGDQCVYARPCLAPHSAHAADPGLCADLPAPGTNDVYRVCTPFPFEANMTLSAAQHDMELHIDNFEAFVYYSPGAHGRTLRARRGSAQEAVEQAGMRPRAGGA
jgi:hypothetical protein